MICFLLRDFINGVAAGNNDVAIGYLEMLKDSIGYDGAITNDGNPIYYFFPQPNVTNPT